MNSIPSTAEEILRWLTMPFLLCWPSMNLIVISVLVDDLVGTPGPGFPPFVTALIALAGSALGVPLCFVWAPRNARGSAQFAAVALCVVALVSFGLTESKSRRPLSFRTQGDNFSMVLGALCAVALVRRAGSSGQSTPDSPRTRHDLAEPGEPRS